MEIGKQTWNGNFVWLPEERYPNLQKTYGTVFCNQEGCHYGVGLFRKRFFLNSKPQKMNLKISASVKYRVYLNGKLLGRGPIMQGGDYGNTDVLDYWFYDCYEDAELLREGENCLSAEVSLQTGLMADYSLGCGGLAFEMQIETADGMKKVLSSDETVCCIADVGAHAPMVHNSMHSPHEWNKNDFDDSGWEKAKNLFEKVMIQRPIPLLQEEDVYAQCVKVPNEAFANRMISQNDLTRAEGSTEIAFGSPLTFTLDFGRICAARIRLACIGVAGTNVTMHLSEIEGKIDSTMSYVMRNGSQEYETWNLSSVRYLTVTVSNMTAPVLLQEICLRASFYPVAEEGTFNCSDRLLNQIYESK